MSTGRSARSDALRRAGDRDGLPRRDDHPGGKRELDTVLDPEPREIHPVIAAVVQFEELLVRIAPQGLVVDLAEDDPFLPGTPGLARRGRG